MSLIARIRDSQFLRFAIVGAGGFVVDESVLALMTKLFLVDAFSSRVVSIFASMTFTWWGNRNLTFHEQAATGLTGVAREWIRFVAANSVGAVVNYSSYVLLLRFAPPPLNNPFLDTAIGVGIGLIFNFTLSKRLVFRALPPTA